MPTHRELWLGQGYKSIGGIPLYALFLILYFFFLVQGLTLELRSQYSIFMIIAIITLIIFAAAMSKSWDDFKGLMFPSGYTLKKSAIPIVVWAFVVGIIFLAIIFGTGQASGFTRQSSYDAFQTGVTQVATVAPTEAFYFRYVLMRTRWGGIPPQILFAVSHPVVRSQFLSNPLGAAPWIVYFFTFGLIFQEMVILGQAEDVKESIQKYFGLAGEIGAHGMFNVMIILYPVLTILDVTPQPFRMAESTTVVGDWGLFILYLSFLAIVGAYMLYRWRKLKLSKVKP
jgi:hypothetical protein